MCRYFIHVNNFYNAVIMERYYNALARFLTSLFDIDDDEFSFFFFQQHSIIELLY